MIKTKRLILRAWEEADFEPFARMNADPTVMQFFPSTLTREQSDALALRLSCEVIEKGFGLWAVSIPNVAPFAGFIGIGQESFLPFIDIGWRLARPFWGQGYATEGALASLHYGFNVAHLDKIAAFTAPSNQRSRRVMERIGLRHDPEGDFDHPRVPVGHPLRRQVLYFKPNLPPTSRLNLPSLSNLLF